MSKLPRLKLPKAKINKKSTVKELLDEAKFKKPKPKLPKLSLGGKLLKKNQKSAVKEFLMQRR